MFLLFCFFHGENYIWMVVKKIFSQKIKEIKRHPHNNINMLRSSYCKKREKLKMLFKASTVDPFYEILFQNIILLNVRI